MAMITGGLINQVVVRPGATVVSLSETSFILTSE